MKRNILSLMLASLLFIFLSGFTKSSLDEAVHKLHHEKKIYISAEQLSLNDEGFFIKLDDLSFQTDSLFTDEQGIFIIHFWPEENGCAKGYEPCRNCKRCVKWYYDTCPYCERPT